MFLFVTVFAFGLLFPPAGFSREINIQKAQKLNDAGMDKYRKKEYQAAAELFREAIGIYPKYVNANYNLACVYAVAPKCSFSKNEREIYKYLKKAILLDPAKRTKAANDPDFESVRKHWPFIKIINMPKTDKEIYDAIVKVGIVEKIIQKIGESGEEFSRFSKNGEYEYQYEVKSETPIDSGEFVTITNIKNIKGKFYVERGKIVVLIKSNIELKRVHGVEEMIKDDYFDVPKKEIQNPDVFLSVQNPDELCGI